MRANTEGKTLTLWKSFMLIITACLLIAVQPARAQDGGQQDKGDHSQKYQMGQEQKPDFSNSELQKFAQAHVDITEIRSEYSKVISKVKDAEKAQDLQSKYTEKMIKTIQDKGLDVKKYNEISMTMQQNPEIREKVEKLIE